MSSQVKYQVFVSSTYEDLKSHRDQVVRAVLEMGHIPVGMEMFSAADETQWELIKRQIEASDYYVVLVAHRYGSMDGAVSYTEKEYDYAMSLGIPTLGFVIQESAPWPQDLVERDSVKATALVAFKEKVCRKIVSHWNTAEDLHGRVSIALMKQFTAAPRDGWVKASSVASPQIISELGRLSQENGELRAALRRATMREEADQEAKTTRAIATLQANKIGVSIFYQDGTAWTDEGQRTFYEFFFLIAPELMGEHSTESIARYVAMMWRKDQKKELRPLWPYPSNTIKTNIADLVVLELVEPSRKKHQVADKSEYWSLTAWGRHVYAVIRKARLEAGLNTTAPAEPAQFGS